jgi:protein required for attachment to host cells
MDSGRRRQPIRIRRGSSLASSTGEHSREQTDRGDSRDRGEHDFARLVAEPETQRQAGIFQCLVIVAPPKSLGVW